MQAQSCLTGFKPPIPLLAPHGTLRYKDAILERHKKTSRVSFEYKPNVMPRYSTCKSSRKSHMELHSVFPKGTQFLPVSAPSSSFYSWDQGALKDIIPMLPRQRRFSKQAQAHNDIFGDSHLPALTEKPKWWMRTLACVPYLIALKMSDTGYFLQRFLECHEYLEDVIYFIPGAVNRLPIWFPMLYCYFAYIGVVKNENVPHYFRYHMMMAMLLEIALQIVWYSSNFAPLIHFQGTFGVQYWAAVGFIYILILLEGIRCALGGKYVEIPFLKESAITQTKYITKGFRLF